MSHEKDLRDAIQEMGLQVDYLLNEQRGRLDVTVVSGTYGERMLINAILELARTVDRLEARG
jgi:hypothetical protein